MISPPLGSLTSSAPCRVHCSRRAFGTNAQTSAFQPLGTLRVWIVVNTPARFAAGTPSLASTYPDAFAPIVCAPAAVCSEPVEWSSGLVVAQPVSSAANAGNASQPKRLRLIATQFITCQGEGETVAAGVACTWSTTDHRLTRAARTATASL
jgi:hypothetical protein